MDPKCAVCGERPPHQLKDCPACWDAETTRRGYLQARVVLTRLLSGNINSGGMWEVAKREARQAMDPR